MIAISDIESRKWAATSHGLRSVSTTMPPSTAWAGMPRKASPARRCSVRWRQASTSVATTMIVRTKVNVRLVNSIALWTPS